MVNPHMPKTGGFRMFELFLGELATQAKSLLENVKQLKSLPSDTTLDLILRLVREIKSGAAIVQLQELKVFARTIEEYLSFAAEKHVLISAEGCDVLICIIDGLIVMSNIPPKDLHDYIETHESEIANWSAALNKILGQAKAQLDAEQPQKDGAEEVASQAGFEHEMMDFFRIDAEAQTKTLTAGLLALENNPENSESIESLMRATHSIKGAARIIHLDAIVSIAHTLEDCFTAIRDKKILLDTSKIDLFLRVTDFFANICQIPTDKLSLWLGNQRDKIEQLIEELKAVHQSLSYQPKPVQLEQSPAAKKMKEILPIKNTPIDDPIIRVSASRLNRLMGLAGESMVETHWLFPFSDSLQRLKKSQVDLSTNLDELRETFKGSVKDIRSENSVDSVIQKTNAYRQSFTDRLVELELFISRHSSLSDRLYNEVVQSRMRPLDDGIQTLSRTVRDIASQMHKKVRFEIIGHATTVDRDILEKLESPLIHLIRNAVDHGIETPEERIAKGKPPQGTITLEASHRAAMLVITVSDDGRGINTEDLRRLILEKNLTSKNVAAKLSEKELLDFLFLPGFSTATELTEISGRGIGLDVVSNMIQDVSGSVSIETVFGKGLSVRLQMPLTLSVIRALLVEIGHEPYAFPLARIERSLSISQAQIEGIENRQYFHYEGQNIGLIYAGQILELAEPQSFGTEINVIVIRSHDAYYGIVVDKFLEERELVVQEINTLLGKIPNISAGSFTEDGSPILIIDVEDLINSIDNLLSGGRFHQLNYTKEETEIVAKKRILIVDDSITVREVECRLLANKGYLVDVAVNGMDGWNAVRMGHYDLVITDVDMPRMNGIEFLKLIRSDPKYATLPVMIVSYKERENDREQGLQAGANYYLTKSSFQDETLLNVVSDLIGKAL